jgi:hypothetical protein
MTELSPDELEQMGLAASSVAKVINNVVMQAHGYNKMTRGEILDALVNEIKNNDNLTTWGTTAAGVMLGQQLDELDIIVKGMKVGGGGGR